MSVPGTLPSVDEHGLLSGTLTKIAEECYFIRTMKWAAVRLVEDPLPAYTNHEARSSDVLHYRLPSFVENLVDRAKVSFDSAQALRDMIPMELRCLPMYEAILRECARCKAQLAELTTLTTGLQGNYSQLRQA